jgi:hypothetical protein
VARKRALTLDGEAAASSSGEEGDRSGTRSNGEVPSGTKEGAAKYLRAARPAPSSGHVARRSGHVARPGNGDTWQVECGDTWSVVTWRKKTRGDVAVEKQGRKSEERLRDK